MKIIKQTIALSILSVSFTFASINHDTDYNYSMMSTVELEKEVEKLSMNGDLPFEMGMELLKRWKES